MEELLCIPYVLIPVSFLSHNQIFLTKYVVAKPTPLPVHSRLLIQDLCLF